MVSIILAFVSFIGWGVGDIFGTIATRKVGSYSASFWNIVFGLLLSSFYIPFVIADLKNLNINVFLINIILGVMFIIGLVAFNEGLKITNASLVATISASFAAVTVILSVIFLKESITIFQSIAITVIFLGLTMLNLNLKDVNKINISTKRGLFLAVVTMITWGIYYTFIKIPVQQIGWFWPQYITLSLFPLLFLFIKLRKRKLVVSIRKESVLIPLLANGFLVAMGEFSFNFAINKGYSAIVTPIAGSYPVLFVVLAFFFFKEKVSKQQFLGIITTLTGVVSLAILSS